MASIDRMIAEIDSFLAFPVTDAGSFWEQEERRALRDLLERMREEKAKAARCGPTPCGPA